MTADHAAFYDRVAISAPNRLVVSFKAEYNLQKETCERPDRKQRLERALATLTGRAVQLDFELLPAEKRSTAPPAASRRQKMRETAKHPLVNRAVELFDGEVVRLDQGRAVDRPPED